MPGTVYTVASGKGGVGKTTTSVNLAVALWREGNAVALVDADIGMANLAAVLDLEPEETLHDVLAGRAAVEEAVVEAKDGDLMVLPGDRDLESFADADPDALRDVVSDLAGRADYVIVDTGAGLSYEDVLPLGMADGVVLVTTPDPAAFGDTMKTMEVAERLDAPIRGLVVTRAVEDTNTEAIAAEIGAEMLGAIPEDPAVMASTVAGDPLESHAPDSGAAAAYRDLAAAVIEGDEEWLEEHAAEPAAVESAGGGEPATEGNPDEAASPEEGEGAADEGRDGTAEPDVTADDADVEAGEDVEADEASEGVADESGEEPAEPAEETGEPGDADPRTDDAVTGDDARESRDPPDEPGDDQEADAEAAPGDDPTAEESAGPADGTEPAPPTPSAETAGEATTESDDDDATTESDDDDDATADEAEVGDEVAASDEDALDEEGDEAGVDDEDGDDADVEGDATDATSEDAEASEEADDEDETSEEVAPEEEADDEPETEERRGGFFGWLGRLFS